MSSSCHHQVIILSGQNSTNSLKINRTAGLLVLLTLFALLTGCANKKIAMEIDYGAKRPSRKVEAKWQEGITALEALKSETEVETHQVGERLFVTSVDKKTGELLEDDKVRMLTDEMLKEKNR